MDELIIEDFQSPIESASEIFDDEYNGEIPFPDVLRDEGSEFSDFVEVADEVVEGSDLEPEPIVSDYVAQFGFDSLYEDSAATEAAFDDSGGVPEPAVSEPAVSDLAISEPVVSDPCYVPVIDDETKFSIEQIESACNDMAEELDNITLNTGFTSSFMKDMRDDMRQIGKNQILSAKVQAGVTVALFGAIIVFVFFSKFK